MCVWMFTWSSPWSLTMAPRVSNNPSRLPAAVGCARAMCRRRLAAQPHRMLRTAVAPYSSTEQRLSFGRVPNGVCPAGPTSPRAGSRGTASFRPPCSPKRSVRWRPPCPATCGSSTRRCRSTQRSRPAAPSSASGPPNGPPGTPLSGSISTVSTGLSWICVGIHSRRALPFPVCA